MIFGLGTLTGHKAGRSNLLTRSKSLSAIIVVSLCSIAYLAWLFPGLSVKTKLQRLLPKVSIKTEVQIHWNDNPRRLIVFGDSWSDDGKYPIDPPPRDQMPSREEAQGKVWTEWLCSAIFCTHHDNFARSLPKSWDSGYSGAVVDNILLNKTMLNATTFNDTLITDFQLAEPLADLKTQVQQWLKFDKQQYATSRVSEMERNGTVFTLWFSLWDLWYYSEKNIADAEYAVTKTMDILFEQLDVIAENWPSEMKIIIPEAVDATFLPAWHSIRTGPYGSDPRAENQRNAVLLAEQWNRALDTRATRWQGGSMYIYNTNEWLLDQVREQQLFESHLSDANGMGANQSPWNNVRLGCIEISKEKGDTLGAVRCSDPNTYLFWDDMHLGPEAMKMIGEGIAQDIAANRADSWFAHEFDVTYEDEDNPPPPDHPPDPLPDDPPLDSPPPDGPTPPTPLTPPIISAAPEDLSSPTPATLPGAQPTQ